MSYKRIIPLFLLKDKRLRKGTNFENHVDVGDPLSQAMIYDAQGADEIVIVDTEASSENRTIDPALITGMITKCRLPIAAGGGIRSVEDAAKLFGAGADKIVLNTAAIENPAFVRELADNFGSQSVVVSIDVKKEDEGYAIYTESGKRRITESLPEMIEKLQDQGAGEFIITNMDREGTLDGMDMELFQSIRDKVTVPLIASGGVFSYDNMVELFKSADPDGVAVGKMLFLRDYDIVRIKSYLKGRKIKIRET